MSSKSKKGGLPPKRKRKKGITKSASQHRLDDNFKKGRRWEVTVVPRVPSLLRRVLTAPWRFLRWCVLGGAPSQNRSTRRK